ncbi:unnamed protein product [Durusdinium trenchii]|uniref:Uncharacterized protein n=1 Tax=Durusdinium trenchii TaxID=1381693 RepID=A0ABP0HJ24_9DINO
MSSQNIELDTIPAEAHWQISHVERAIKCTKHIMTKLAMEDPEITAQEALAEALRTENEREIVRGYSPAQHDLSKHYYEDVTGDVPELPEFERGNQGAILKNRDGVPVWSGDSSTFEEFVEACLLYEQTVVKEKRYLCGPRIASELSGSARRILIGKSADWLSFDGGVRRLVAALRAERGQSKVPEMSELLMKYFKGTRRQRGEGMNDFVMRKAEAYTRAQQSMARYQREHPKKPKSVNSDPRSQHSSIAGPQRTWKARNSQPLQEQSYEFENEGYDLATEEDDPWAQWHARDEWEEAHSHQSRSHHTESWKQSDTLECSRDELPEILPDFIQGWASPPSMEVEQEKMVEAYAVMQEARQTLREARAKQHAVRMARQYYPVKGKGKGNEPQSLWKRLGKTPPRMQCFRCGGPHKVAECREKPADQSAHVNTQEQAPFVFFTDTVGEALMGESQVVRLERTAAGHQVLPLTTDAYETARSLRAPLPCFSDLE